MDDKWYHICLWVQLEIQLIVKQKGGESNKMVFEWNVSINVSTTIQMFDYRNE